MSRFVSFAQNGEDVVVDRALRHIANGRFVDVGAYAPVKDSVTRSLVLRGWRGVHVEPVPDLAAAFRAEYPDADVLEAVVSTSAADHAVLHRVAGTGLSSMLEDVAASSDHRGFERDAITVAVTTLAEVSRRPDARDGRGDTHLLKVDVEGNEADVLRSADFTTWRPWVLVIEAMTPGRSGSGHLEWEPHLLDVGYEFCLFDGLSRFYVAREHADLLPLLSYPACVLDDYEPLYAYELRTEWEACSRYAARLEQVLKDRDQQIAGLEARRAALETQLEQAERPIDPGPAT